MSLYSGKEWITTFTNISYNNTVSYCVEIENILTSVKNCDIIERNQNKMGNYAKAIV